MATKNHNLSDWNANTVPDGKDMRIGIVVSEWNELVTYAMAEGAKNTLMQNGVKEENITIMHVPGSFELVYGAARMIRMDLDAVIAIGCVIRGDTPHFDYICEGTTNGLARLNAKGDKPVVYGLLTTNNLEQALDRCGGKLGNKGDECAITAMKMIAFGQAVSATFTF